MKRPKKSWLKSKGYLHITDRLEVKNQRTQIYRLVKNPRLVAAHAFFPLIHKSLSQRRFKIVNDPCNKPLRKHYITSASGKKESTKKFRSIRYATHIDAHIYSYYSSEILQKKYEILLSLEPGLSECIIAYRRLQIPGESRNKSSIHFAKEVFLAIQGRGNCIALAYDIKNFFPSLNHRHIKRAWCELLGTKTLPPDHYNIYNSITRFSYINLWELRHSELADEKRLSQHRKKGIYAYFESPKHFKEAIKEGKIRIYKNQKLDNKNKVCGIPQGLAISAMLANLYLLNFDRKIYEIVVKKFDGFYRRYSDDIVIVVNESKRKEVELLVDSELKKLRLQISKDKTEICRFKKQNGSRIVCTKLCQIKDTEVEKNNAAFRYLGFEFDGQKVCLHSKNISKFYRRMKYAVKTKARRIEAVQEKQSSLNLILFRRKLYRSYTCSGARAREITTMITRQKYDKVNDRFILVRERTVKKYWGNFIGYALRADKIMKEVNGDDTIKRQIRNHWKILQQTIYRRITKGG